MAATAATGTVNMSDTNVDSLLRGISSTHIKNEVESSYDGVESAIKHSGTPTNNVLLSVIHGETKRTADEISRLNAKVDNLQNALSRLLDGVASITTLLETQNEILASSTLDAPSNVEKTNKHGSSAGQQWYYNGNKLTSRYHVYACILFHLMEMVQVHITNMGKHYPDSVDCDFKIMHNAVRVVATERCSIPKVEYKNTIAVKTKDSQPFDMLYPLISSTSPREPTTLLESLLSRVYNPVTRNVMQDIEWIRQRLCYLDGILSPKQIDILKSIGNPILRPDSDYELNWSERLIKPRSSHPLARDIADLPPVQKNEYIKFRMQGSNVESAYESAKNFNKK